jgi:hypothetical protein
MRYLYPLVTSLAVLSLLVLVAPKAVALCLMAAAVVGTLRLLYGVVKKGWTW